MGKKKALVVEHSSSPWRDLEQGFHFSPSPGVIKIENVAKASPDPLRSPRATLLRTFSRHVDRVFKLINWRSSPDLSSRDMNFFDVPWQNTP